MSKRLAHLLSISPLAVAPGYVDRDYNRNNTDRQRYLLQKSMARRRGIAFKLTFPEWLSWWHETGHYNQRGKRLGEYVMARKGDIGAYEIGNIECILATTNVSDGRQNRKARALEALTDRR